MTLIGRGIRYDREYSKEVSFSQRNDFDFMQIWFFEKGISIQTEFDKLETIKTQGYPIIFHAVLEIYEIVENMPYIIPLLKTLDHHELIIHPVCEKKKLPENGLDIFVTQINEAVKLLKEEGIELFLENNSKINQINYTIEDIKAVYENPDVHLLLDVAHIDSYDHLKEILEVKYPRMLHIADKHFSVDHEHIPIGEGDLDYEMIFKRYLNKPVDRIIFEIDQSDEAIVSSRDKIIELIKEAW